MEFSAVEIPIVRALRFFSRNSKIILTIHNVFPHGANDVDRKKYKQRFLKMDSLIDHYIVHTESTANTVQDIYKIGKERIMVVPHGIFKPNYHFKLSSIDRKSKKTIIFYGVNRKNKGGDILINAVRNLPFEYRERVKILMVGKTSEGYLSELKAKAEGIEIEFNPNYIPDQELYSMIDDADYIALPYREISQSGVLLLALYFRKPLLISDLPSFRETLKGFSSDMFFKTDNAESMSNLIVRILNGNVDVQQELKIIDNLNNEYSWEKSAQKTISLYKSLVS